MPCQDLLVQVSLEDGRCYLVIAIRNFWKPDDDGMDTFLERSVPYLNPSDGNTRLLGG